MTETHAATHTTASHPDAPPIHIPSQQAIRRSYLHCRRIVRLRARNFYYGMMLTPQPQRSALYAIYGFMRACDDMTDAPQHAGWPTAGHHALRDIEALRHQMERVVNHGHLPGGLDPKTDIWPAFLHVTRSYPIHIEYLHTMLDGQCDDLTHRRYETFSQTYDYCCKVAGTVGLVCLSVWGYRGGAETRKLAEYRGVALQLTNILRDLVEDAHRGRVYLPAKDLDHFGYDPAGLLTGMADHAFDELMTFQINRARSYYQRSAALESHVDPACRAACWVIMKVYQSLLEKIARQPRRVLSKPVRLRAPSKLSLMMRAACRRWYSGDTRT